MKINEVVWSKQHTKRKYDAAFSDGHDAFKDGIDLEDNPFAYDEVTHDAWHEGWIEAAREKSDTEAISDLD